MNAIGIASFFLPDKLTLAALNSQLISYTTLYNYFFICLLQWLLHFAFKLAFKPDIPALRYLAMEHEHRVSRYHYSGMFCSESFG